MTGDDSPDGGGTSGQATLEVDPAISGQITFRPGFGTYIATEDTRPTVGEETGGIGMYRGYLTFDLTAIPESVSSVSDATLHLYQKFSNGTPFGECGEDPGGPAFVVLVDYGESLDDTPYISVRY